MRLTIEGCRRRQQNLAAILTQRGLDGAVISRREHVYYFTGFLHHRYHGAAAYVDAAGRATLVGDGVEPGQVAVDDVIPYEAGRFATMHSTQFEEVAARLAAAVPSGARTGADLGGGIACIAAVSGGEVVDVTRDIYGLRKHKLADEVEAIRDVISMTDVMYRAAREVVRPGAGECRLRLREARIPRQTRAGPERRRRRHRRGGDASFWF